ncbi:MAG TPA: TetR family transcriptional regulator [Mycobacterium sp.]|nr:TetR family transcriptional regulator [Mycobacterium sp.]
MRVTRKQAELNRQRVIDSAMRLFAQRGVDGASVADVMADAGFTHGGFYNHFASKEELVIEACSTSFAQARSSLRDDALPQRARDADFGACVSAAMLCESAKGNGPLSATYAKGISEFVDVLTGQYGDRDRAATVLACLVGARVISRAVELADRELAHDFGEVTVGRGAKPAAGPQAMC